MVMLEIGCDESGTKIGLFVFRYLVHVTVKHLFVYSGNAIKCVICDSNKDGLTCFVRPPPAKECNPIFPHCISVSTFSQETGEYRSAYFIMTQKFLTSFNLPFSVFPSVQDVMW